MSQAPINQDPLVARVAALEGRLAGVEKRLDDVVGGLRDVRSEMTVLRSEMATKAELRVWGSIIMLALAGLFTAVLTR